MTRSTATSLPSDDLSAAEVARALVDYYFYAGAITCATLSLDQAASQLDVPIEQVRAGLRLLVDGGRYQATIDIARASWYDPMDVARVSA
jgi:hypothetical protein